MQYWHSLLELEGQWQGNTQVYAGDDGASAFRSPLTAAVVPALNNTFVRVDYQWQVEQQVQEGFMLLGFDRIRDIGFVHWADTWHMGTSIMVLKGSLGVDTGWNVFGTYRTHSGPDWGWRMKIQTRPDQMTIEMFNVSPEGFQTLAVESVLVP